MNAVEMRGISKNFGTVQALSNVDFTLRQGEIHAVLGENGAGKTTLMKILYGMHKPSSGEIFLNGKSVTLPGLPGSHSGRRGYGASAFYADSRAHRGGKHCGGPGTPPGRVL